MSFTKVSNLFLPLKPLRGRPIWLLGGIQVRTFPQTSEAWIFPPTYSGVRFFQHYTPWAICFFVDMFYPVQDIFLPRYFLARFFSSKSLCRIFFSEITHNPLKRQMVGPKITPTFAQYSFFVRIVKDWNSLPNYLFNDEINVSKFKKGLKRWMKIYWHSRSYFNCIYFHFVPALMIFTRLFL